MSKLHFLNVGSGDCIVIEHASGRTTMFDICGGNRPRESPITKALQAAAISRAGGNFKQCEHPSNPLDFLAEANVDSIFRFVLSHPDCDHLDGFDVLLDEYRVANFWHAGLGKEKPDFHGSPYKGEDWDRYEAVRDGKKDGTTSLLKRAGARFRFANKTESGGGGDGLYILAPDNGLVEAAELSGDYNDASYVLLYRSVGGRVLITGDAHDKTWEYVLGEHGDDLTNVGLLIAPHHGRKSGRDFGFLDTVRPALTLFGCAPSDALAYDAWRHRNLPVITNNQAGCVTVELQEGRMSVYVENRRFAEALDADLSEVNAMGYYLIASYEG